MTTTYSPATFALKFVDANNDFQIYQGGTYEQEIQLTLVGSPLNLSAYGGTPPKLELRKNITDTTPWVTPVLTWIDASTARIKIRIEAATTLALSDRADTNGVGDIKVFNGADALVVALGTWAFKAVATR